MRSSHFVLTSLASLLLVSGCGSKQAENSKTAADAAQETAAEAARQEAVLNAPKSTSIAPQCKRVIRQMVTKQEGGQQYLLDDATLWQVMPDNTVALVKKLPDVVDNYRLIPSTGVIIHYTNDKIMLTHVESNTELFNLKGDPSQKFVMYTPDNKEMTIRDKDASLNVWNVPERFSGIQLSETVQDFINRQSPDYRLRFSVDAYAISLAGEGRAVLASDDTANNKIGLIYYMDDKNAKGVLKSLARTNKHITHLGLSLTSKWMYAVDADGQLYVSTTGEDRGFKIYAKNFTNTRNAKFIGDNVLVIEPERLVLINTQNGNVIWTRNVNAVSCYAPSEDQLLCSTGDTIEDINARNGKLNRTYFFNDTAYGILSGTDQLEGSAPDSCLMTN